MHNQASLGIAKIAVLVSLLFMSQVAYAEDGQGEDAKDFWQQGTWKHGFGIKHATIPSGKVGDFLYPGSNLQVFEYSPIRDFANWSMQFTLGSGVIIDHDISGGQNISSLSSTAGLDFGYSYFGLTVLTKVNSSFSLGLSNLSTTTTIFGRSVDYSTDGREWGFALSFHDQSRKHALEINLGEDTSTLGYRWGWDR